MKYFADVTTLDDLKKEYRRLAMIHHPDCGGKTEDMQAVNAEYEQLFEVLKTRHNDRAAADTTGKTKATTETADEYRRIVEILLGLDGLSVELCGSWLWIGGETRKHKDALKAAGCRWSNSKKLWYWRHAEEGARWSRSRSSMGQIRDKYGSCKLTRREHEVVGAV